MIRHYISLKFVELGVIWDEKSYEYYFRIDELGIIIVALFQVENAYGFVYGKC